MIQPPIIMLPPELVEADRVEYEHLRTVVMMTREEAVREIRMKRSRRIVNEISKVASG